MKSVRQQFADTMLEVGLQDPNLVVLVGDISHFVLQPFANACTGRYYNVGICEPTIVSIAAGLAGVGFHPVVHTIAPFLIERSFEQIKLDACYQKLGINIVTVGSAFDYSNLGCTHHCYNDFALLKTLEDTQITCTGSAVEFDQLFRQTYKSGKVTSYRTTGNMHKVEFVRNDIQFGKGIRIREGSNLTIIAVGSQLRSAVESVERLISLKFDPEILYIHTIRPLDNELITSSLRKTKRVIVLEEHMTSGGLGDDVLRISKNLHDINMVSISIPDRFVRGYGTYEEHCEKLGLNADGIINTVRREFQND